MNKPLIIGTRGSPLALWQARWVQSRLAQDNPQEKDRDFPIRSFTTSGDKLKGALSEFGGKGLFTKELESALTSGEVDMAVHSMKDVPTQHQDGLQISALLPRADHRDAFISKLYKSINDLPEGACVGTASIRRRAQLSALRPDIKYTLLRGNVGTRLSKLEAGACAATFLACAGLNRLGQGALITQAIDISVMLNAPAQGAVGVETRADNARAIAALSRLNDPDTALAVSAERGFLEGLDGSCRTPIAAFAQIKDARLILRGEVLSLSGAERFTDDISMPAPSISQADISLQAGTLAARDIGLKLAARLRGRIDAQAGGFERLFQQELS